MYLTHPFSQWCFSHCNSCSFLPWGRGFKVLIDHYPGIELFKFLQGEWFSKKIRRYSICPRDVLRIYDELAFLDAISEPEESYVHTFGSSRINHIGCKSLGHGVVYHNSGRLLGISKFFKRIAKLHRFGGVLESSASASATDATTHEIILLVQNIGPLMRSGNPK